MYVFLSKSPFDALTLLLGESGRASGL